MNFRLTKYQDEAAKELLEDAKRLLQQTGNKKLIFKAPTGSGKTITMAEFLTRFADEHDHQPCAFIWTAPRQLHEQSKDKLESYFENTRAFECSYFEGLKDRQIGENEILFFNWESIRQENNIYIRENEQENNLSIVIERTRDAGRSIILIIDESHYHAQAETSQELITALSPNLTIEVSATPIMQNPDKLVAVDISDVKSEEMIKKAVILNENFENVLSRGRTETIKSKLANSTDDVVLQEALNKHQELAQEFATEKINVNPLLLIQLPDRHGQADDDRQKAIVRTLKDKHKISIENGKLAIYLSENKENLENLKRNDSDVDVLIFKQAIALGWDCPRAQVLVLFREWHSPIFSIQTLGRIMRVPEPECGYYESDKLNYAYVYTNINDIEIKQDIGRDYVIIYTSYKDTKIKDIQLTSVHSKRYREQTRLSPLFTKIFLEQADAMGLSDKINRKDQHVRPSFISDWKAENIDTIAGTHLQGNIKLSEVSDIDLQRLFDYFSRKNLSPFHPEDRSVGRIKESIYQFFDKKLGMDKLSSFREIINTVLSEDNQTLFERVISETKRAYVALTEKRERELVVEAWNLPQRLVFDERYTEIDVKKAAMKPFYSNENWQSEKAFIDYLEKSNNVLWWFKNGERDATFFAVPYKTGKYWSPFYVDFVVMTKDGQIGLFDPHGTHLSDFNTKSEGLKAYIAEMNKKGHKMLGGIIANTDPNKYQGQWLVYDGEGKDVENINSKNWKPINI